MRTRTSLFSLSKCWWSHALPCGTFTLHAHAQFARSGAATGRVARGTASSADPAAKSTRARRERSGISSRRFLPPRPAERWPEWPCRGLRAVARLDAGGNVPGMHTKHRARVRQAIRAPYQALEAHAGQAEVAEERSKKAGSRKARKCARCHQRRSRDVNRSIFESRLASAPSASLGL